MAVPRTHEFGQKLVVVHVISATDRGFNLSTTLWTFRNLYLRSIFLRQSIVDQFRTTFRTGKTFHSHSTIMTSIFNHFLLPPVSLTALELINTFLIGKKHSYDLNVPEFLGQQKKGSYLSYFNFKTNKVFSSVHWIEWGSSVLFRMFFWKSTIAPSISSSL